MSEAFPTAQNENMQYGQADNIGYTSISALQIRLDATQLLLDIKEFLEGKKTLTMMEGNKPVIKVIELGKPKANSQGIQGIMAFISGVVNPQTVQGNFDETMYYNYCKFIHLSFAKIVYVNMYDWEIAEGDIKLIIRTVIGMVRPFMSRLIGNKERESYERTMQIRENSRLETQEARKKVLGIF